MNKLYSDQIPLILKLRAQKRAKPIMLFSDLDDTYYPKYTIKTETAKNLSQKNTDLLFYSDSNAYRPMHELFLVLKRSHIPLCLVSGQDFMQFKGLYEQFSSQFVSFSEALMPDLYIGAVGTEIWVRQSEGFDYVSDKDYSAQIKVESGYNRGRIVKLLEKLIVKINTRFQSSDLRFQKRDQNTKQSLEYPAQELKVSLEFEAMARDAGKISAYCKQYIREQNLSKIRMILSYQRPTINFQVDTYNLDFLAADKFTAVNYIVEQLKVAAITAGDSGNDTEMLFNTKSFPIIVGGAKKELLTALAKAKAEKLQHYYLETGTLKGPSSINKAITSYLSSYSETG